MEAKCTRCGLPLGELPKRMGWGTHGSYQVCFFTVTAEIRRLAALLPMLELQPTEAYVSEIAAYLTANWEDEED